MNPLNLFIAASVVLFLAHRAFVIVRESFAEAVPIATNGNLGEALVDGVLQAGGRLLVLLLTALAISCAIALARQAPSTLPARPATTAEVVRLEPVVVSIAAARFDAIRAEEAQQTRLAQRASTRHAS